MKFICIARKKWLTA